MYLATYIDVRGPWPVLFEGFKVTVLVGSSRGITVEQALLVKGL